MDEMKVGRWSGLVECGDYSLAGKVVEKFAPRAYLNKLRDESAAKERAEEHLRRQGWDAVDATRGFQFTRSPNRIHPHRARLARIIYHLNQRKKRTI